MVCFLPGNTPDLSQRQHRITGTEFARVNCHRRPPQDAEAIARSTMSAPKNHPLVPVSAVLVLIGAAAACLAAAEPATTSDAPVDFARDVQPLFAQHCYKCHDGQARKGGLQLDAKQKALAG